MTQYIKADSDRPNYFRVARDANGNRVDLEDADNVQFVMFDSAGVEVVNDTASIEAAHLGEVAYDFDRSQVADPGEYAVELRVDWADGDEQWLPTEERGFELFVVDPPGPRGNQPEFGHDILIVPPGETYEVDGEEQYARIEIGGEIVLGPNDETIV